MEAMVRNPIAVSRIRDILVQMRIRGSERLKNGSAAGFCSFLQWPSRHQCTLHKLHLKNPTVLQKTRLNNFFIELILRLE
jgi:hypothetical protein